MHISTFLIILLTCVVIKVNHEFFSYTMSDYFRCLSINVRGNIKNADREHNEARSRNTFHLGKCLFRKIGLGTRWAPVGRPLGARWAPIGRPLGARGHFGRPCGILGARWAPIGCPLGAHWVPVGRPLGARGHFGRPCGILGARRAPVERP